MSRKLYPLLFLLLLSVFAGACSLLKEPEEASAPIEAVPLEVEADASQPEVEEAAEPAEISGELRVYTIDQTASQVRFELDEDLRGQRNTVIGVTDQVAGEIAIELGDLSSAQLGLIQVNARTLATDNDFRNRAIANRILNTGEFEFISFSATAINGLSGSAEIGEEIAFSVDGELTIRDITQPVTFEIVATAVSETQISGTASTVVNREDYGLNIPSVRDVANVEEEVELTIDFVANAS